jgi:hypothetical protein
MHYAVMSVVLTVRDVPEEVRDLLAEEARRRGQSLQAYVLQVLRRQSEFSRNRQLLTEIESELAREGGAGQDAPDAAELLGRERERAGDPGSESDGGKRITA